MQIITQSQYTNQVRTMLNLKSRNTKRSQEKFETALIWLGVHASERKSIDMRLKVVIYGLIHTYNRGSLDGTYSLALRKLSAWKTADLVGRMAAECSTDNDVRAWLREHRNEFVKEN
jgi:hypothetical protein